MPEEKSANKFIYNLLDSADVQVQKHLLEEITAKHSGKHTQGKNESRLFLQTRMFDIIEIWQTTRKMCNNSGM